MPSFEVTILTSLSRVMTSAFAPLNNGELALLGLIIYNRVTEDILCLNNSTSERDFPEPLGPNSKVFGSALAVSKLLKGTKGISDWPLSALVSI
jgi:hypothetical protein